VPRGGFLSRAAALDVFLDTCAARRSPRGSKDIGSGGD
jgi:hypothetical protein